MIEPGKRLTLFLVVFFVLGISSFSKAGARDSNFQEFKAPLVKCSETTMLCGLEAESELLGADPLEMSQQSRVRIAHYGKLELRVRGTVPDKTYDVLLVYTPGMNNVCSEPEPEPEPIPEPEPEPDECVEEECPPDDEEPPMPPSIVVDNSPEGLPYLVYLGSFTTDSRGRGRFQADVSEFGPSDSVHVLITDHDEDKEEMGDVPRQFITGFIVRD
jgi:hypothetical protein